MHSMLSIDLIDIIMSKMECFSDCPSMFVFYIGIIFIADVFVCSSCAMLWPLFILGYVVLVTSRPPPSPVEDILEDYTWRELPPEMLRQSSQWIPLYNPKSSGPGDIGNPLFNLNKSRINYSKPD